eukprot:488289-Pelagomonas_calceolata.AAC.1
MPECFCTSSWFYWKHEPLEGSCCPDASNHDDMHMKNTLQLVAWSRQYFMLAQLSSNRPSLRSKEVPRTP